ncbi:MAG: DivIVA domain-containing protein, partial [Actinomycetota bacterium]
MTEPDRKRVVPSAPRLSPDEIAARAFPSKVRGYAEPEVRTFLGLGVAADLARERPGGDLVGAEPRCARHHTLAVGLGHRIPL